ncbi:hypothetical protein SAMN05192544_103097 [Paraburkholderia hospita]|nr:hypothetical protein SAMN05192544_103097 [Paraburkholderia hospita]
MHHGVMTSPYKIKSDMSQRDSGRGELRERPCHRLSGRGRSSPSFLCPPTFVVSKSQNALRRTMWRVRFQSYLSKRSARHANWSISLQLCADAKASCGNGYGFSARTGDVDASRRLVANPIRFIEEFLLHSTVRVAVGGSTMPCSGRLKRMNRRQDPPAANAMWDYHEAVSSPTTSGSAQPAVVFTVAGGTITQMLGGTMARGLSGIKACARKSTMAPYPRS